MNNINVYIKESVRNIAKKGIYIAPDIPEKKLNNVIKAFNCESFQKSILAIYDNTLLGSAKEGLVFTGEKLLYNNESLYEIYYKDIKQSEYLKDSIVKNNGKEDIEHYILIKTENKIYKIDNLGTFNYQAFERLLNDIINNFDVYAEEDQLKTISEMTEEFKVTYLKAIVNMTYIDDNKIDDKELIEILLLMTRLKLDRDTRFLIRSYIAEISQEDIITLESLLTTMKENSETSHHKSLMISLAKDLINVYFSSKNTIEKNFKFIEQNRGLLGLSNNEIDLAYETVINDHKMLKEDLDDDAIKKGFKELSSKAIAVGTPIGAVYLSGSVAGLSAAGMTSGLASLGMGGVLGFSGMVTGIGAVVVLGIGAYKGMQYLTGANELTKYKTRELMLHEVIKQTQKTISLIIDDINYVVLKLNETILKHADQTEKIKKLSLIVVQFQGALKSVDSTSNTNQNSVNRLHCPKILDKSRMLSLTDEPIKKPIYNFILSNYENNENNQFTLKNTIDSEVLEKMSEIFQTIGYFDMHNAVKSKATDGLNKIKGLLG